MRFLIDEDMPRAISKMLVNRAFDAVDVRDIGLKGCSDEEIYKYAINEKRIIFSRDKDFANLLKFPLGEHAGIVILRVPSFFTANKIKEIVEGFIKNPKFKLIEKNLTILEIHRIRIRRSYIDSM